MDGGIGGQGQNGGTGWSSSSGSYCFIPGQNTESHFMQSDTRNFFVYRVENIYYRHSNKGSMPMRGGNGGRGGIGGLGGLPGTAYVYKVNEESSINKTLEIVLEQKGVQGEEGPNGLAGTGGTTGCRHACSRTLKEVVERIAIVPVRNNVWLDDFREVCEPSGLSSGGTPIDLNKNDRAKPLPFVSMSVKYEQNFSTIFSQLHRILELNDSSFQNMTDLIQSNNRKCNHLSSNVSDVLEERINFKLNDTIEDTFESTEKVLTLRKYFLNASELIENLGNYKHKYDEINHLILIVHEAFHFDRSIKFTDFHSVTLISPKWTVDPNINVDLSGLNGGNDFNEPAENGWGNNKNGYDGSPGISGKNSGNFYGFGHIFTNLGRYWFPKRQRLTPK